MKDWLHDAETEGGCILVPGRLWHLQSDVVGCYLFAPLSSHCSHLQALVLGLWGIKTSGLTSEETLYTTHPILDLDLPRLYQYSTAIFACFLILQSRKPLRHSSFSPSTHNRIMGLIKTALEVGGALGAAGIGAKALSKHDATKMQAQQEQQQQQQPQQYYQQPTYQKGDNSGYQHQSYCNGQCGRQCRGNQ
jgi:hypothetical protein